MKTKKGADGSFFRFQSDTQQVYIFLTIHLYVINTFKILEKKIRKTKI